MKTISIVLTLSAMFSAPAQETLTLEWSSITGGGSTSSNTTTTGEYTVETSLGQIVANESPAEPGSAFSVSTGYWTFTLNEPLDLGLRMQLTGGNVSLTWDDTTGIPVRLESSTDLQLWAPVNPQPPHPPFLEPVAQRRYYRLMPAP